MSIPGKLLVAVLSAVLVSFFADLIPSLPDFQTVLGTSIAAGVLSVILSHKALPMPKSIAASESQAVARSTSTSAAKPRSAEKPKQKAKRPPNKPKSAEPAPPAASIASEAPSDADSEEGTVKWFNGSKGFGFLVRENGEEVFVHHRSIIGEGRRNLRDGAKVRFTVMTTDKGPQAENVKPLD